MSKRIYNAIPMDVIKAIAKEAPGKYFKQVHALFPEISESKLYVLMKKYNIPYLRIHQPGTSRRSLERHGRYYDPQKIRKHYLPKPWTRGEELILRNQFEDLPRRYGYSLEFLNLCSMLRKPEFEVRAKIAELGLKKPAAVRPVVTPVKKKVEPAPPPKRTGNERPPAVYTNSRSCYGIADMLHAGNRIYI
jgi:hypothetical protein